MDVFADVLQTVRARRACSGKLEAAAPWGIEVPRGEHACFHVVLQGKAWLGVPESEPTELLPGDLVILPHGEGHVLADSPLGPAQPLQKLWDNERDGFNLGLRSGGSGPRTVLVCGRIEFEGPRGNPLLAVLPRVVMLKGEVAGTRDWLEPMLRVLACEVDSSRPGAQTIVCRLADVLFIQIVRSHLAAGNGGTTGWLAALSDAQIGGALSLIHQNPERPWTVQELAEEVAMSRSAFAARFTRLVGEPPLSYVTRWRMQKAAALLRERNSTLAQIALSVGYDSEAAFSKAFKRALGSAPGAYRRAARTSGYPAAA